MTAATRPDVLSRFWAKVDKNGPVHPTLGTACWLWTAAKSKDGYGRFLFDGCVRNAHRAGYIITNGPTSSSLHVDHLCRNRACVRPSHMEVVLPRVNYLRGDGWSGRHARKTHCPVGHEYDYVRGGSRCCHQCEAAKARERRARNPEKYRLYDRLRYPARRASAG